MTHWKNSTNASHKKKHQKKDVMSKKQLKAFFGHSFDRPKLPSPVKTVLTLDDIEWDVTLIPDKNGNIQEIIGLPETDGYVTKEESVPSTHDYAMNLLRGQAVELYRF